MKVSSTSSKVKFEESLIQLLWDQWAIIGAGGARTGGAIPFVIDPEALILATTRFGMSEPRLREICYDWLRTNGSLISVQRLKNIQKTTGLANGERLKELADYLIENGHPNWKSIAALVPASLVLNEVKADFSVRSMSRSPQPVDRESFLLKLRNFFGMSARAEVLHWLLTHKNGHAALIAKETCWLPKTVQLILNEWQAAGIANVYESGREKTFSIKSEDWSHLRNFSGGPDISWLNQVQFYSGANELNKVLAIIDEMGIQSIDFTAIQINRSLKKVNEHFEKCSQLNIFPPFDHFGQSDVLIAHFESQMHIFHSNILDNRNF